MQIDPQFRMGRIIFQVILLGVASSTTSTPAMVRSDEWKPTEPPGHAPADQSWTYHPTSWWVCTIFTYIMKPMKLLAKNRRATFDYDITERLVAGLSLLGDEVKSIKAGFASLKGSFIALYDNEAYLIHAHITPYARASRKDTLDPTRNRKLLLHRKQLDALIAHKQAGLSVVPTALLLAGPLVKLEIGIGRGKKRYDKRESIKQRDTAREIARNIKR